MDASLPRKGRVLIARRMHPYSLKDASFEMPRFVHFLQKIGGLNLVVLLLSTIFAENLAQMSKLTFVWNVIGRFKYLLVIGIVVLVVGFADENSCTRRKERQNHMREMRAEIDSLKKVHDEDSASLDLLVSSREEAERIGRETYFMHRSDEDVFIVPNNVTE